jgi:hypothetical protein
MGKTVMASATCIFKAGTGGRTASTLPSHFPMVKDSVPHEVLQEVVKEPVSKLCRLHPLRLRDLRRHQGMWT